MNLDELLNAKPQRSNPCKWSAWWKTLNETEQTAIRNSFTNEAIETSHIVRVLQGIGCPMSESTIRTHRRNECKTCQG